MAGSPPRTNVHQTPGTRSPGYGFSQGFFNSLPGVGQNPYPTYQGQIDPGLSPTMQNLMRQAQAYSQAGPPEILQGAAGSLGRFMSPNFINPQFRIGGGFSYPNYFPSYGDQRMYGGMTGADSNPAGSPFPVGGGNPRLDGGFNPWGGGGGGMPPPGGGVPTPGMPRQNLTPGADRGGDISALLAGIRPAAGGAGTPVQGGPDPRGLSPQVQGQMPQQAGGSQNVAAPGMPTFSQRGPMPSSGLATLGADPMSGGGMPPSFSQRGPAPTGPPMGTYGGQVPGAQTAWDMGNLRNRGMVQNGMQWVGGGGGETGQWQPYDPNNYGMRQSAEMFNRYGSNWNAGSGATSGHFTDMAPWLTAALGRAPTQQEQTDLYYGVGNVTPQAAKSAFAAQSAAYDPSSASYDPNARYTSAAYRGPQR